MDLVKASHSNTVHFLSSCMFFILFPLSQGFCPSLNQPRHLCANLVCYTPTMCIGRDVTVDVDAKGSGPVARVA